jgi:uncharacterized phage protein gp47/JayE
MSLTEQGFDRPRLLDIKSDYDQRFKDALGPVNTNPDSVIGQMIAIFAAAIDDAYEALQDTYDAMYPSTAEGVSLDGSVSFVGLERLAAAPTVVTAMCYGTEGSLIPAGAIARASDNRQYAATADTVISRSNAGDIIVSVASVENAATYQIIADGVSHSYLSDADATAAEIIAGLAAEFDPADFLVTVEGTTLRIRAADQESGFPVTLDSKLVADKVGTPVSFTALIMGAYALPAGALTTIDSVLTGWSEVNNLLDGVIGRFVESDEELRVRHNNSVRVTGAATAAAIRSRLLAEVDSVTYVALYENRTADVDEFGLPPHSFETVVSGGTDQAIADKLFEIKPAGIETYGNTSIDVMDENGDLQQCNFSRPTDKYAWIRVTVNALNTEETLSTEIVQAIKDAVLAYGAALSIGEDLILQRIYGPIFDATQGLATITIEADLTALPTDVPVYATANIALDRADLAVFADSRITVVGV